MEDITEQEACIRAIVSERNLQDEMWGPQTHDPAYWLAILGKQVGQLGTEVLNYKWANNPAGDLMFAEAKQVAAVALAMMEAIVAGRLSDEVTSVRPEPRKLARVLDRGHEAVRYDSEAEQVGDEPLDTSGVTQTVEVPGIDDAGIHRSQKGTW